MATSNTRILIYALALAAAFCVTAFSQYAPFIHDDAFISLRYCQNLLSGHGLVWNPGERVEGYTSCLHVLLVSGVGWLGVELVTATRAVGVAAFLGLCAYLLYVARRLHTGDRHNPLILAAAILPAVCSVPVVIWTLGGLETVLYALLGTIAVWTFACHLKTAAGGAPENGPGEQERNADATGVRRDRDHVGVVRRGRTGWPLGLLFATLAMTRPDGALLCLIAGGFAIHAWRRGWLRGRYVAGFALAGTLACAAFLLWRYNYYGAWLPNTYHAKAGFSVYSLIAGTHYIVRYTFAPPGLALALLLTLVGVVWRRCVDRRLAYLFTTLWAYGAYVAVVGGDHMAGYRFLVPIIPLMGLTLNLGLQEVHRHDQRHLPTWCATLCPLLLILQLYCPNEDMRRAWKTEPAAYVSHIVADYVRDNWPPGALIASNAAGALPYRCAEYRFVDMLGLNDPVIARRAVDARVLPWQFVPGHLKGDGAYVLQRAPDYIILGPPSGTPPGEPWFLSDLELVSSPQFRARYEQHTVRVPVGTYPDYAQYIGLEDGICEIYYWKRKATSDALAARSGD